VRDIQAEASGEEEDEDEDEEKERISSALYFPHQRTVPEGLDDASLLDEGSIEAEEAARIADEEVDRHPDLVEPSTAEMPDDLGVRRARTWVTPAAADSSEHIDISLHSKDDSRVLHSELRKAKTAPAGEAGEIPPSSASEYGYDSVTESETVSEDESGLSGKEDDSSVTDEGGTTPTATGHIHHARHVPEPPAPLGAVELKPYRHQVGGHTTVFRFSRRAVCKQLNNRENVFYERIERRHPEMLMFLPRFVFPFHRRSGCQSCTNS
jgi:hypothetical protein